MALAGTPGVVWAEDTPAADSADGGDSIDNLEAAPVNPSPASDGPTDPGETGPGHTTPTTVTDGQTTTTTIGGSGAPEVTISGTTIEKSDTTPTETPTPTAAALDPPTAAQAPIPVTDSTAAPFVEPTGVPAPDDNDPITAPDDELVGRTTLTTLADTDDATPELSLRVMSLADDDAQNLLSANLTGDVSTLDAPPLETPNPIEALLQQVQAVIYTTVVNAFVAFFEPLVGPGAPFENPALWAVLAFARREVNREFANSTPVISAVTSGQDTDPATQGVLVITVTAADPDADPLTYNVTTDGLRGTVTPTTTSNTFIYTPNSDWNGQAYTDTVTVTVSDQSDLYHLHALGQSHTATGTFTVNVPAASSTDTEPVVGAPGTPSDPDATTGAITGTLGVTDPDGDILTYTIAPDGQPTYGRVTFDAANGTYTYTPTQAARIRAGLTAAVEETDSFTVVVIDEDGNSVSTTISNVKVAPVTLAVNDVDATPITIATGRYTDDIVISPDGTRAYILGRPIGGGGPNPPGNDVSGTGYGRVFVVDLDPGSATFNSVVKTVEVGDVPVAMAVTPDGKRVYVTNGDSHSLEQSISVIDTDPTSADYNTVVATIVTPFLSPRGITITPDGSRAYVANFTELGGDDGMGTGGPQGLGRASRVTVIDLNQQSPTYHTVIETIVVTPVGPPEGNALRRIVITADGTRAYVTNEATDRIYVIDTNPVSAQDTSITGTIAMPSPTQFYDIEVRPDGKRLYILQHEPPADPLSSSSGGPSFVTIIDTDPASATYNNVLSTTVLGDNVTELGISTDGSVLYAAQWPFNLEPAGTARLFLYDTYTDSVIPLNAGDGSLALPGTQDASGGVATTPDGRTYVVDFTNHTVTVVSVVPGSGGGP